MQISTRYKFYEIYIFQIRQFNKDVENMLNRKILSLSMKIPGESVHIDLIKLANKVVQKLNHLTREDHFIITKDDLESSNFKLNGINLDKQKIKEKTFELRTRVGIWRTGNKNIQFRIWLTENNVDQQCCGYFLRDNFIDIFQISLHEASLINVSMPYVKQFLNLMGYTEVHRLCFPRGYPKQLKSNDRVLLENRLQPVHCMRVSCESDPSELTEYLIDNKDWFEFRKFTNWEQSIKKYLDPQYGVFTASIYRNH